ncbi:hypothetical protein ONZ51_g8785 [Trametes cubensis]|uniref:Uncharacterized protein n=1 Tax=Trametes cubensis TaxID=1111947 RepID=A0AAD7X7W6_9APHY|nr:hypothetical protein ONZ51_g8785 [Trametes cubensis]
MLTKDAFMSLNNFETLYDSVARNASAPPEQEVLFPQLYGQNHAFAIAGKRDYLLSLLSGDLNGRATQPNKFYYRTEKADPTLHFGRRRTASHLNAAAAAKRDKKTHMNGAVSNGRDAIGRPYRTHLIQTVSKALMRKSFEIVVSDPDMRAWYFQGCDCRNDNGG